MPYYRKIAIFQTIALWNNAVSFNQNTLFPCIVRGIFSQKRSQLKTKIKFFKNFLTPFILSSYENPASKIEYYFRSKYAHSSNYRGGI